MPTTPVVGRTLPQIVETASRLRRAFIGAALSRGAMTGPPRSRRYTATLTPAAPKTVYLQVGVGSFTANYNNGGQPGNNATVNTVSATVAAAVVGNGTAQAMTTDSTATQSFWDGFTFCSVPGQLYIGGFYRTTGGTTAAAQVTATVPAALTNATGNTIPFSKIQLDFERQRRCRRRAISRRHLRQWRRAERRLHGQQYVERKLLDVLLSRTTPCRPPARLPASSATR